MCCSFSSLKGMTKKSQSMTTINLDFLLKLGILHRYTLIGNSDNFNPNTIWEGNYALMLLNYTEVNQNMYRTVP